MALRSFYKYLLKGGGGAPSSLLTNLNGYWKMDEASGNRIDSSGNGNDLTPTNAPGSAAGKISDAAVFVAASAQDVRHVSNASLTTGNIDFTLGFWAYITDLSVAGCLVQKSDASSFANIEYECYFSASSGSFLFRVSHGTNWITVVHPTLISVNTWYYVLCSHDITLDRIAISINNGADTTASMAGFTIPTSTAPFIVGSRASGDAANARIDELGFWKKVLTADEKTELYNGGTGITYPF